MRGVVHDPGHVGVHRGPLGQEVAVEGDVLGGGVGRGVGDAGVAQHLVDHGLHVRHPRPVLQLRGAAPLQHGVNLRLDPGLDGGEARHVVDGEGEDGGGGLAPRPEQVHHRALDVALPVPREERGRGVRGLVHLLQITVDEVPLCFPVVSVDVIPDGSGGDLAHLLGRAPRLLEHAPHAGQVAQPGEDEERPRQVVVLDEGGGGAEHGFHLRVRQRGLLTVEDLPERVDHGEVGAVLQVDGAPGLRPELRHELGHLLTDHILQRTLPRSEILQSLHGKPSLFSPRLSLAAEDASSGLFVIIRLEQSVKSGLKIFRSAAKSVIFEGLVQNVKVVDDDALLVAQLEAHDVPVSLPPSVERVLQIEADREEAADQGQAAGAGGEIIKGLISPQPQVQSDGELQKYDEKNW